MKILLFSLIFSYVRYPLRSHVQNVFQDTNVQDVKVVNIGVLLKHKFRTQNAKVKWIKRDL